MRLLRSHHTTTDVIDGSVRCPLTDRLEDIESCLTCARLAEVAHDADDDAPNAVRCRLEASWRDVPAAFMS